MNTYCFTLTNTACLEEAWDELEKLTIQLHYSAEEPEQGVREIYGDMPNPFNQDLLTQLKNFISVKKASTEINWSEQWETYSQFYHDGYVHVELKKLCPNGWIQPQWSTIKLEPGPGFGDLSHSTTRLVLNLMQTKIIDRLVIDVGCGSGVLSLAAVAMGAQKVYGIDIDDRAVAHAQTNGKLNLMEEMTVFIHSSEIDKSSVLVSASASVSETEEKPFVVLMNMIQSEQLVAWKSLATYHSKVSDCFISGILAEGRDLYLEQTKSWGWRLQEEIQEEGWLAFHFTAN
jgi:ribosomal protein L11 methyltransferase